MRLALAQIDPTVGDLDGNADLVLACLGEARRAEADIVVFPELVISGYPPEDLLLKDHFLDDCREALERVLPHTGGLVAVLGLPLDRGDRRRTRPRWWRTGRSSSAMTRSSCPTTLSSTRSATSAPAPRCCCWSERETGSA